MFNFSEFYQTLSVATSVRIRKIDNPSFDVMALSNALKSTEQYQTRSQSNINKTLNYYQQFPDGNRLSTYPSTVFYSQPQVLSPGFLSPNNDFLSKSNSPLYANTINQISTEGFPLIYPTRESQDSSVTVITSICNSSVKIPYQTTDIQSTEYIYEESIKLNDLQEGQLCIGYHQADQSLQATDNQENSAYLNIRSINLDKPLLMNYCPLIHQIIIDHKGRINHPSIDSPSDDLDTNSGLINPDQNQSDLDQDIENNQSLFAKTCNRFFNKCLNLKSCLPSKKIQIHPGVNQPNQNSLVSSEIVLGDH